MLNIPRRFGKTTLNDRINKALEQFIGQPIDKELELKMESIAHKIIIEWMKEMNFVRIEMEMEPS
jgi:predicted ATP-binding protein involved in virulence